MLFRSWSGYFDGTGDYIEVADNATLRFGTGDFTVEAWIYPTSFTLAFVIASKGGSTSDWAFACDASTGRLYFGIGTTDYLISTGPVVTLNAWHHVAWVRSGTTMQVFLDGVSGGTSTNRTDNFNTTAVVRIGRGRDTSTNYAKGYISNVRITNGTALYTSGFTPSTTNLTTDRKSTRLNSSH